MHESRSVARACFSIGRPHLLCSGSSLLITVNGAGKDGQQVGEEVAKEITFLVEKRVVQSIVKQQRPGGALHSNKIK